MTREKEVFTPIDEEKVRMYSCGLTVYDYAHIGNLRAYVFVDLLRRWLEYRGYDVKHVMTLTDVDDKTIRGMKREGMSLKEYTQKYIKAFHDDLLELNILKAKILPKATEHVYEMVKLIETLMEKDYAYKSEDGSIYYNISRFKHYGKLSKMKIKELKAGARVKVDEYSKGEARDFALWRAWDEEDGDIFWETTLGKGRPGWHIECSAMSMKYLGETLDIHTGGVDNIFPHHENEIAQSEAATGKMFVRYWLHNEHLLIKGERMGKSLKNFYTLRDLIERGYEPLAVRYLLLATHYRKQLHFNFEGLEAAKNTLQRLFDFIERLDQVNYRVPVRVRGAGLKDLLGAVEKDFEVAMDDDLDVNKALATVFKMIREVNTLMDNRELSQIDAAQVKELLKRFDKVLGVLGGAMKKVEERLPKETLKLIERREEARKAQDWKTADSIRKKLQKMGIILEDTPEGVKYKRGQLRS
jgi:cysteinyl-tRNA synthetase